MAGIWIDIVLLLLLAAVAVVFFAVRWGGQVLAPPGAREPAGPRFFYYRRLARQAGFDPDALRPFYLAAKIALALLLPLVLMELLARFEWRFGLWATLLVAIAGFFAPDLWLVSARRARKRQIRNALSFFLDLIVALVRSGLGLEDAFRRAGRDGLESEHPLAVETAVVGRELEAGKEREYAFQSMAERTGVPEVFGVASALRMGARTGAAVETTLAGQADLLRVMRREQAMREISLAALKTLLPVMLCGFPIFFVLAMFPVAAEIVGIFSELARLF